MRSAKSRAVALGGIDKDRIAPHLMHDPALVKRGHHVEVIHCTDSYRLLARHEPAQGGTQDPRVVMHSLRSRVGLLSPLASVRSERWHTKGIS